MRLGPTNCNIDTSMIAQKHLFIVKWCGKREAGSGRRCHYDTSGKKVKQFSWDLQTATNNKAEALAVPQGLKILKLLGMGELRVLE